MRGRRMGIARFQIFVAERKAQKRAVLSRCEEALERLECAAFFHRGPRYCGLLRDEVAALARDPAHGIGDFTIFAVMLAFDGGVEPAFRSASIKNALWKFVNAARESELDAIAIVDGARQLER